jgi:hypothetical protein
VRPKTIAYFERIIFGMILLGVLQSSSLGIASRRPRRRIPAGRVLSS